MIADQSHDVLRKYFTARVSPVSEKKSANYVEPHGFLVEACAVGVYQALSPDLGTRLIR